MWDASDVLLGIALLGLGWIICQVNLIATKTKDIHRWHAPNAEGVQSWKGDAASMARLISSMESLNQLLREFLVEARAYYGMKNSERN